MRQAEPPAHLLGLALLAVLLLAARLQGGDWHSAANSACSDCHTMHNSRGGAPMRYDNAADGAPRLLRHATPDSLCAFCHDGSMATAPDVVAPVTYVDDPAGGAFPENWTAPSDTGHSLGGEPVTPPGGRQALTLACITCHDPHGGGNYRNLRANLPGAAEPITVTARQNVLPSGSNPAEVYVRSNITDKAGMAQWCGACHGTFHGRSADEEGTASPWLRHPQEAPLSTGRSVDYRYWLGDVARRVRVLSPGDDVVPSADDQVFCLSCHKAHGSPNRAALIFSDGASASSTCAQCHNK